MPEAIGRRGAIAALGGAAAWPLALRAQQMPVIGLINSGSPDTFAPFIAGFQQGLKESGFIEGQNVAIEYRWAHGQYDRLPALAADLAHRRVDAIADFAPVALFAEQPMLLTAREAPIKPSD
jgi:putative ABC transport system substrate-binding protein